MNAKSTAHNPAAFPASISCEEIELLMENSITYEDVRENGGFYQITDGGDTIWDCNLDGSIDQAVSYIQDKYPQLEDEDELNCKAYFVKVTS